MRKVLKTLTLRKRVQPKYKPLELHKLPWPPFFYKTLKLHIESTTPPPRF